MGFMFCETHLKKPSNCKLFFFQPQNSYQIQQPGSKNRLLWDYSNEWANFEINEINELNDLKFWKTLN